jgi:hypothetical protein
LDLRKLGIKSYKQLEFKDTQFSGKDSVIIANTMTGKEIITLIGFDVENITEDMFILGTLSADHDEL